MGSDDDDLFGDSDSDDTAELIASSKSPAKKPAAKKPAPKKKAPAKQKKADSDSDKGGGGGLFDSDDSDSDDDDKKQPAKKPAPKKKELSKRERLEALARRKNATSGGGDSKDEKRKDGSGNKKDKESGYNSGDSYDSATFQRTQEDDDFIDTTGENAEDVQALYAEQHFDDERPDDEDHRPKKKKNKRKSNYDDEAMEDNGNAEPDNPIMAAVHRMKKKKRAKKLPSEIEDEIKVFLNKMDEAAEQDEQAVAERRPATQKISMLSSVCDMLANKDMQRKLLDLDLLTIVKRWVQPLPGGKLGNVTVRQRLLEAVSKMTGENGVNKYDLKSSELGKTVMILFKHKSETPAMKRQLRGLVEQWSRPIFQKSGNMRDLERFHHSRGVESLNAVSRAAAGPLAASASPPKTKIGKNQQDIQNMISQGKKGSSESGVNRVRVPFSKGFDFSVRPTGRQASAEPEGRKSAGGPKDNRAHLSKRMVEKGRTAGKNQRSANISIEGRRTKG